MNALGANTLDHSHLSGLLITMSIALLSLVFVIFVLAQLRRSYGQAQVILLGGCNVNLDSLAYAALVDFRDIIQL